ncbi:hypothetical protein [Paenibacillus sp. YN15]|uniref:hypothetical protein n=1 Tax=Paenibacillus sp. YN15 TaxID=1742774 RepID=UPI0015EBE61C|nr:hypothetical protein [Paenibacillus sp. YN15]
MGTALSYMMNPWHKYTKLQKSIQTQEAKGGAWMQYDLVLIGVNKTEMAGIRLGRSLVS